MAYNVSLVHTFWAVPIDFCGLGVYFPDIDGAQLLFIHVAALLISLCVFTSDISGFMKTK